MYPDAAMTRTFVASPGFAGFGPKWSAKRSYLQMYGFVAVLALPTVALFILAQSNMALAETVGKLVSVVLPFVLLLFIAGWCFWYFRNNTRRFTISVSGPSITIDERPGAVFRFSDARLGLWAMNDATMGTVLHLHSGPTRFVLGGRDHRIGEGTRLDEAPVVGVDAWLTAREFDELLAMMGRHGAIAVRPVVAGGPVRCKLLPNAMKVQTMTGLFDSFKVRRLMKEASHAVLAIDVDPHGIRVIDLRTNAEIAAARNGQWRATPATYQYGIPWYGHYNVEHQAAKHLSETTEMVVHLPGMPGPLTIACRDVAGVDYTKARFRWRGAVEQRVGNPADYAVTSSDWLTLVEKFGLAPYLENRG